MMQRLMLLLLLLLTACAAPRDLVTVLEVFEVEGHLTVRTPQVTRTLDAPYQTAAISASGEVQPSVTTPAEVQARYGAVLGLFPPAGRVFTLRFESGKTTLTAESQQEIPAILAEMRQRAIGEVEITGHTDQAGEDAANDVLAFARAETVRVLLMREGLTATFVRVVGRGSRAPLVDAPGQAHAQNRRVEVLIR